MCVCEGMVVKLPEGVGQCRWCWKDDSVLQSATPKISSVVTPRVEAAEVLALLTECALNMLVSIPASTMICFSHLAMVDDVIGSCSLMKETNNCVAPPLSSLVLSI